MVFQNANELVSPKQSVQNEAIVEFINIGISGESFEEEALKEDNKNTKGQANEKNLESGVSGALNSNFVSMNVICLFVMPIWSKSTLWTTDIKVTSLKSSFILLLTPICHQYHEVVEIL